MSRVPATNVAAFWDEMARPGPALAPVGGVELGRGSRVRLVPKAGGDVLDLALAGRVAVVEGLETDPEGSVQLAVTLENDPGRDLGARQYPAHRFYFALDQVEPLPARPSIDGSATAAGPTPAAAPAP